MEVAIIGGRGKMGNLFVKFFDKKHIPVHVLGRQSDNFDQIIRLSDIIILSVPLLAVEGYLTRLEKCDLYNKVVINFASNMSVGYEQLRELDCATCCMHPLFGPDIADFANQNVIVAPKIDHPKVVEFTHMLLDASANVSYATPEYHDKMMGVVQALSQFTSLSLAWTIMKEHLDVNEVKRFSTVTFRSNMYSIERILKQPADLWSSIQFQNLDFPKVLDTFKQGITTFSRVVQQKDDQSFRDEFEKIHEHFTEKKLPLNTKKIQYGSQYLGVLGPSGSYSHYAALIYDPDTKLVFLPSVSAVIEKVGDATLSKAIVPFENSLHGVVVETLEGIRNHNVFIVDQVVVPIHHCIGGIEMGGEYSRINEVYSHSQALAQCSAFISRHLPHAQKIEMESTSAAFKKVATEKLTHAVAIGPKLAAESNGLHIYDTSIEDDKSNVTAFFVISKEKPSLNGDPKKVLLYLQPQRDQSGLLCEILSILKELNVNLSMIESRPSRKQFRLYSFYLICDSINSSIYSVICEKLEKIDIDVTLLGCF